MFTEWGGGGGEFSTQWKWVRLQKQLNGGKGVNF